MKGTSRRTFSYIAWTWGDVRLSDSLRGRSVRQFDEPIAPGLMSVHIGSAHPTGMRVSL